MNKKTKIIFLFGKNLLQAVKKKSSFNQNKKQNKKNKILQLKLMIV